MLMSFFQSSKTWDRSSDGLYSSYSDIVFADSVAAKLRDAVGDICIVVSTIRGLKMLPVAESQCEYTRHVCNRNVVDQTLLQSPDACHVSSIIADGSVNPRCYLKVDRDFRRGGGARPNHPWEQVEDRGLTMTAPNLSCPVT